MHSSPVVVGVSAQVRCCCPDPQVSKGIPAPGLRDICIWLNELYSSDVQGEYSHGESGGGKNLSLGELLVMVAVCYPKKGEESFPSDTDIILTK